MVEKAYTHEIQEVFKLTLLDTLVTHVGTPSSGSASEKTCIRTCASKYLWYIGSPYRYLETSHRSTDRPPEYYSAIENNAWEDIL
jgi:hypothetical protein